MRNAKMNIINSFISTAALALLAAMSSAYAYELADGVLTVSVADGAEQENLTEDQLAGLSDPNCTELRKVGGGELRLSANPVPAALSRFGGTIRIAEGIYTLGATVSGMLGTTNGATVVESGATLKTATYLDASWYRKEHLIVSGTGFGAHGAIWHTGTAGDVGFGFVTLCGDTTVVNDSASKTIRIKDETLDMGGCTLTMKATAGGAVELNPSEIVNAGHISITGNRWGIPSTAVLDHGTNHTITLNYSGTRIPSSFPSANLCNWTLKIVNPNCGIRAYDQPFEYDGPVVLPDSGTFTIQCDSFAHGGAGTPRPNCWFKLNGPISGGSAVCINTANIDDAHAENDSMVIFAGTNTYSGGTQISMNSKGPVVCMIPEALPGLLDVIESGMLISNANGFSINQYRNIVAFGARTANNPYGWTDEQIKKAWSAFQGSECVCAVYAAPGDAAVVNMDGPARISQYNPALYMSGIGGGSVTFVTDWADNPDFFQNQRGTNTILSAKGGASSEGTLGTMFIKTGRVTLLNAGHISQNGDVCIGTEGVGLGELVVGEGTVLDQGTVRQPIITIGYRRIGGNGRLTLLPGGIVSNGFNMSGAPFYVKQCSAFVQRGGEFMPRSGCAAGASTNSTSYIEIQDGASDFGNGLRMAIAPGSCSTFVQSGGDVRVRDASAERINSSFGEGGTSTVYVAGGMFAVDGDMYLPRSFGVNEAHGGCATFTVDGCVTSAVSGRIVMGDRVDSTAMLNLNGGAVLSVDSIEKKSGTTSRGSVTLSGNSAYVSFDGGVLKAQSDGELFKNGSVSIDRATVCSNGAIIDTDGHDVSVPLPLVGPFGSGMVSIEMPEGFASTNRYVTPPSVIIFGDGTGASAVVNYDEANLRVTNVTVTSAGCGYTRAEAYLYRFRDPANPDDASCMPLNVKLAENDVSGGLLKKGDGTLELSAENTYSGSTVVEAGRLMLRSSSALPQGSTVVCAGGTVCAASYSALPKSLAFGVENPVEGRRYVLAEWNDGTAGRVSDFSVSGLPAGWGLAVRGGSLMAMRFRGTVVSIR